MTHIIADRWDFAAYYTSFCHGILLSLYFDYNLCRNKRGESREKCSEKQGLNGEATGGGSLTGMEMSASAAMTVARSVIPANAEISLIVKIPNPLVREVSQREVKLDLWRLSPTGVSRESAR